MSFSAVERVWESIQFECLANGTDCNLDSACLNSDALATGTSVDMLSEGGEEFDAVECGDSGEHGVHAMEGFDELFPMVPIVLPFLVRHHHDASINALPFSLEKTQEASLLLRQKPCHEQFCSGKEELNVSKNLSLGMLKVLSVAVLQWKVRKAVLAMVLLMPAMDNEVRGDASLMWMRIAKALVRLPAMGEMGGTQFVHPTNGGGVVAPGGDMDVS